MRNSSVLFLFVFTFFFGTHFRAHANDVLTEDIVSSIAFVQQVHELKRSIEAESYAFTKDLCYIFKFRHHYGNEEFPSILLFHPFRVLQKYPYDDRLRRSIAKWFFLVFKDVRAIFSETAQAEYGILYRSAYSKFLPVTAGFAKASRECGEEIGKEHFSKELVKHIHTNAILASSIDLVVLLRGLHIIAKKIIQLPFVKSFRTQLSTKTKKVIVQSLSAVAISQVAIVMYIAFTEVYEQSQDLEKARKILIGETPVLNEEQIEIFDKSYLKILLDLFYKDYIYSQTASNLEDNWEEICLEKNNIYHKIFTKYANTIIKELFTEIPISDESMLEEMNQRIRNEEVLTMEEKTALYESKLYIAIRLILDGNAMEKANHPEFLIRKKSSLLPCTISET